MNYAERCYYDNDHCSHVVAREEHFRILRIQDEGRRLLMKR